MTTIINNTVTICALFFFFFLWLVYYFLTCPCNNAMQAFEAAWAAACKVEGSTMVVPYGFVFLVKPITFSGPNCQPNIQFQVH